jgi:hypothetical protein
MKITKSQLKQIIKEELDLARLAGGAVDDYHLLLLETAELYGKLASMYPDQDFLNDRIKNLHASFSRMYKRAELRQKSNK